MFPGYLYSLITVLLWVTGIVVQTPVNNDHIIHMVIYITDVYYDTNKFITNY